ncbi:MAG TPA: peroxiredoxin family protein [Deinococcales bacterium]|nr:peroxiredoxin family protein [Deinococcales bacterium]
MNTKTHASAHAATRRAPGSKVLAARWLLAGVAVVGVLAAVFVTSNSPSAAPSGSHGSAAYPYAVGKPGLGELAPPVDLPSTSGKFNLADFRGQNVLLFFQEGVLCEGCWTQMRDVETNWKDFQALGVDRVFMVTSDPLDASREKLAQEGLGTPTIADPTLVVSRAYDTTSYGMMGDSTNGHSFILVGRDGKIRWRADYGGAPKYFMYIPYPTLLNDLKTALGGKPL